MSAMATTKRTALGAVFVVLPVCTAILLGIACAGALEPAQADEPADQMPVATDTMANEVIDAFTPHGSAFGKNETVAVKTDLSGKLDSVSVEEWIKNPDGLDSIEDASNLQNIVADDDELNFTQQGESLVWNTGGGDVRYTGTSAAELPFSVEYRYELDGVAVEPGDLRGVTGKLAIHIDYRNNTSATIQTASGSYEVQDPFVMASIISFDAEHARDVEVDSGTVVDQQGTLMAVGIGMPGLAKTLDVEDMADLPESVTITADVKGFDMPDITTIATDQVLGQLDSGQVEETRGKIDDAVGQLDNIATAVNMLAKGNEGIATATGKIAEGQAAMAKNLPNTTEGIAALAKVADAANQAVTGVSEQQAAIVQGMAASVASQQQALESQKQIRENQQQVSDSLDSIVSPDGALDSQRQALEALQAIVDSLDEDQRPAVSGAIADLEDAIAQTEASSASVQSAVGDARSALDGMQSQLDDADTALQGSVDALSANAEASQALMQGLGVAAAQTKGLSEGLTKAGAGFEKLQEGVQQMSTALTQVSEGAKKLDKASTQLGKGVEEALDTIRSSIDAKIDLVNALSDYVSAKPAFGGSVADMPANTLYIVRAKAESTPLR